ncbi:hypothetical protein BRADI_3g14943v3 [Brachypodium distachyon]|uniref:Uncharacterized protein n=1 Tax=Brachypodium distachyon TaxID=15368 RepID=A0A0Q3Q082_BRADI|nr:hypothetical protein BRADI_3g14943v3 [Brachypodium distachyon]
MAPLRMMRPQMRQHLALYHPIIPAQAMLLGRSNNRDKRCSIKEENEAISRDIEAVEWAQEAKQIVRRMWRFHT